MKRSRAAVERLQVDLRRPDLSEHTQRHHTRCCSAGQIRDRTGASGRRHAVDALQRDIGRNGQLRGDAETTSGNLNGVLRELIVSLARSPDYSAAAVIRTLRGVIVSQAALLPQLATTDLVRAIPRLDVPLVMAQGRLDQVAPGAAAQRFHDSLTAPGKQLVWFESSAHTPHLEEPAKFRDLLMNVRASQFAST